MISGEAETTEPVKPVKMCRCGSTTHSNTNYSKCILNRKNIHLLPQEQVEK